MKRTPLKRGQKPLKRTRLKPISNKKRKEELEDNTWEEDKEFYLSIWKRRDHRCYETGEYIYGEILSVYFHHVLPKERFPEYRYESWNIVLVTHETHQKAERDLDLVPKIKKRYLELLEKHSKLQEKNQL